MLILYKNDRNVRFVLFTKTSNVRLLLVNSSTLNRRTRTCNMLPYVGNYERISNKKVFQSNTNRPLSDRCMGYMVNNFEQVESGKGAGGYHVRR